MENACSRPWLHTVWLLVALGAGCKKKQEEPAPESAKQAAEPQGEAALQVDPGSGDVAGPVPPEISMVFFTVEGALLPIACFDQTKASMAGGKACTGLVSKGEAARLASTDTQANKVIGAPMEPQCLRGEGTDVAFAAEGTADAADYIYAAWPPSALKAVKPVDRETLQPTEARLTDEDAKKVWSAIHKRAPGLKGELIGHQQAYVNLDGKGRKERFISVIVPHPTVSEQFSWSGAFLAMDDNLDDLIVLDVSTSKRDVFALRGILDLDGDGFSELWMRVTFEDGGGDRLVSVKGGKPKALAPWSCGAGQTSL